MKGALDRDRPRPGPVADLAAALALGGDCQADIAVLRGHRFTCFATDAKQGQLADLELRLAEHWPWAGEIPAAITRLQAFPCG